MFRNLTVFAFPLAFADFLRELAARDPAYDACAEPGQYSLQAQLAACALKPVGPLELSRRGFVSPFGRGHAALFDQVGDALWVTLGGEDKILPAAVVNDMLQKKLAEIEDHEGRKPSGRARRALKEDLVHHMLPVAFVKPGRADALIDLKRGLLVVDTSSRKVAENVASELRSALGSFPALPLNAEQDPSVVMTGWLAGDAVPMALFLDDECALRDPTDAKANVKCQRQDLRGDEVQKHLESGKRATRLGMVMDDHLSFVLGEDMVIRKLKMLDGALVPLDNLEPEDAIAEHRATFAILAGEVGRLYDVLAPALKLTQPQN